MISLIYSFTLKETKFLKAEFLKAKHSFGNNDFSKSMRNIFKKYNVKLFTFEVTFVEFLNIYL